ncbi:Fcf2p [Kluyveromyces lactis]|uniref:KLLA0F25278p n=1 Tax=Kluyveromyces lactis (strain ATCC 8585 / CBS 2359 / DSM 70799 / NBRC 1267 / NRRL Y-1140 / WM37) TaxID=284590 RepID=Q6CIN2_KLULA|nr:uncharacterized protein KLLA0_F25278g [Kluyveromyces lactis]CAG98915.1 KLLA0F25278p [Kluyveromyces lactis]|eukprot:XP_456207.1 uncharacterized protein KLLA0_F25278g [Kluyveromyces lactis]
MDSLNVDELFADLKRVVAEEKQSDEPTKGDVDGFHDDKLSVEIDDKTEQFQAIERNLKRLPKLQTGFDQLGTNGKQIQVEEQSKVIKIDDPIYILESRKKSDKVKPPTETEKWFTLPKTEMTAEVKRDLMIIKHRAALDPKRHYKKDKWKIPERFSVGTIIEGPTEFYSSRLKNKERKNTMLETLMADDTTNKYFKRKYTEVQQKKTSGKKAHYNAVKDKRRKF